jgi:hypothetical protein
MEVSMAGRDAILVRTIISNRGVVMDSMVTKIVDVLDHGIYGRGFRTVVTALLVAGLLGGMGLVQPLEAQNNGDADTTFTVTVEDRTDEYPHDDGWDEVYAVDGVQGEELTLERGTTYYFIMDGVPDHHPFYITTDLEGAGAGQYTDGVSSTNDTHDDRAWDPDTLMFTPDDDAPDELFYNCINHPKMGYRINIVDPTSTDIEGLVAASEVPGSFHLRGNFPNPFNPATTVRFDLPAAADVQVQVFDMLGRQVMAVDAGRMSAGRGHTVRVDASSLTSGIYIYRVRAVSARDEMVGTGQMTLVK